MVEKPWRRRRGVQWDWFSKLYVASPDGDCWEWRGRFHSSGYAYYNGRAAHRILYERVYGSVPRLLVLDHLCRNRRCVNPHHLRVCTRAQNTLAPGSLAPSAIHARRTHCVSGHPFSGENLRIERDGTRRCRACQCAAVRRYHARLKLEAA